MPSARTNPPVTLSAEMQRKDRPDRSRDSASGQPGSCGPSLQLLAPGDASESICIVLTGDVDVMLPELPVKGQSVVNLKPGGVFGESTFFPKIHTRCRHLRAIPEQHCLCLTAQRTTKYQEQPSAVLKLANNTARILAARLQETDEWVWDLVSQSQQAQMSASWRRFRHRITGNDSSGGFFVV